jgi:hypothetical protein
MRCTPPRYGLCGGDVTRAQPLGHDPFKPELAGMTKHDVACCCYVVVNLQPYARLGEQSHKQHLAALERFGPQVVAI